MNSRRRAPRHSIDISEADGVRYLHFGSDWVQGAMRIARPWSLELVYTREMMAGLLFTKPADWPRRVLQIGLGAGSLSKFLYRHLPDCRLTVVEINPQVEFAARQYFRLPDDPQRLEVVIADGADYLLGGDRPFDWIIVDGFDPDGRAGVLETTPFYQACRARLADAGLLAVNFLGRDRSFRDSLGRLRTAFADRLLQLPSSAAGNSIAFAHGGESRLLPLPVLRERAQALKRQTRLDLLPTLTRLQLENHFPDGLLRF